MKIILLFALIIFSTFPAHAHRPYLIKQGTVNDLNGNKIIKEKLYGDGIFTADPVTFQLRHLNGEVLANSPVGAHVANFCPTIKFCWAFPYSANSPFTTGWVLAPDKLNFETSAPNYDFNGDEADIFKKYLEYDSQVRAYSYAFGYPKLSMPHSGFIVSPVSVIFSPLVIIADQFLKLLAVFILTLIPFFLHWIFFKWKKIEDKQRKYLVDALGTIILLGYLGFYMLATFIIGFTTSGVWFYMLASMIGGVFIGKLLQKKLTT